MTRTQDARLETRCTSKELTLWKRAAKAAGRTITNWVQYTLTRAARRELELDPKPQDIEND